MSDFKFELSILERDNLDLVHRVDNVVSAILVNLVSLMRSADGDDGTASSDSGLDTGR